MGLYCLSDAGLTALGEGFTKLDKLSLLWCSNVTSASLKSIAEKCCSLRSLDLQDYYVGDQGAAVVGKCYTQLEDLNLRFYRGLTDTGLIVLAIGCGKTLKSVGVAACAKLTNISLEAIGSHCRSLEKLSLDSEFINNKGILVVAKGCRLLKVLKLQCINVTDEALQAIGIFCLSLELLALYNFQRFTGKSLCAIGEGCKKLKKILL
ncbi:F-box/LRR-repeat protein 4 [Camellia lanceoleosa]|uniref:F-box/LRR-repeat protein 4 n=1 Tax=Camellia lanceoleosa TaxID=1840588 RepID=A0ACC0GZC1_9ERIC|nr:F-box/LRR-repeat protein 4 [Camellia lanceoleosa]